jgi:cation-transporting ATPase E
MSDMTDEIPNTALKGLTDQEVEERVQQGLINHTNNKTGKSVKEIIMSNLLTYFNLIFFIIAILLIYVGSYRNLTFLPIIIGNIMIGIVQELRAKQILDKMNIVNAPHSVVLRNGVQEQIVSEDLVKDDIILLSAGNQICADAVVVEGKVQVNEALLTGEADEIEKICESKLLSGSFVVSGQCYAKLEHVGNDSYISKLTAEAKATGSGEQSEMIRSINQLVKWIGIIIIPIGALLFYQGYFLSQETMQKSIISMVAALIGMIPEGLYLLTTIALALSTMRLAKRNILLHDMKSIETLARVDVLCVDKTGTITETRMQVEEFLPSQTYHGILNTEEELTQLFVDYSFAIQDDNATIHAIKEYTKTLDKNKEPRKPLTITPFTSTTKYSGVAFEEGIFILGAPEFVMREDYESIVPEIGSYIRTGHRVLVLGKYEGDDIANGLTKNVVPLGFVILSNPIRKNAKETFSYFKEQGVTVKVISGDNPETVSEVARCAGIENAHKFIDAGTLDTENKLVSALEEYTVFGRVTPKQKQKLVQALQKNGHTVAMTGDGVNDILAMKDADCSVAMASGSEAATQAAQVVLLDSDFAHMPDVVLEGRQVVNNVQRSAVLFLVKNIFSLLLSLFSVVFMFTYPLEPSQISLISMFTIGIPGFLLAMEPNKKRIEGHFLKNVMIKALPAGLTDVLAVGALVFCGEVFSLPKNDIATASTLLLAVVGFIILTKISAPFNRIKYGIIVINILGLAFCGIFLHRLYAISEMSKICIVLLIVFAFAAESLFRYLSLGIETLNSFYLKIIHKKNDINK